MIELGQKAKDKITGFVGLVTSRQQYITGCDQYTLSPEMNKDKTLADSYSFDEGRIEIIGKGITVASVQTKVSGGPQQPSKSVR